MTDKTLNFDFVQATLDHALEQDPFMKKMDTETIDGGFQDRFDLKAGQIEAFYKKQDHGREIYKKIEMNG